MMRFTPPVAAVAHSGVPAALPQPVTYVWSDGRRGRRHQLGDLALSILAVLGVGALCLAALTAMLEITPLVVRSGSMEPALPVGSLALATTVPANEVAAGEIVSVEAADGSRVTHRVVGIEPAGAMQRLTLRGDANAAPDAEPAVVSSVERVVVTLPGAGRLLQRLGEPRTHFVVGLGTGMALLWTFGPAPARPAGRWVPETTISARRLGARMRGVRS